MVNGPEKLKSPESPKINIASLGGVDLNIADIFKNNPDADFDAWQDMYSSEQVQAEMKVALVDRGNVEEAAFNKFIEGLNGTDDAIINSHIEDIKKIVHELNVYGEKFRKAGFESENFKTDMIMDSVKGFLNREVVEGFQTQPLWTMAKIGVAGVLLHQLWKKGFGETAKKRILWGTGIVAGLYILNGMTPSIDKKERTLWEMALGTPKVKSPAFREFLNDADLESREKISTVFAVADTKIDKLVELYRMGKGTGEIDIDQLIDYTDPDSATKLERLNTHRSRKALYDAIDKLIVMAGFDTAGELLDGDDEKEGYRGQPLSYVVIDVYSKQPAGTDIRNKERNVEGAERISDEDRSLTQFFATDYIEKDIKESEVLFDIRDERIWINGFPFKRKIQPEKGSVIDAIVLSDPRGLNDNVATLKFGTTTEGREDFINKLREVAEYASGSEGSIITQFKEQIEDIDALEGFTASFDTESKEWEVKKSNSDYVVPSDPKFGLKGSGITIPLSIKCNSAGEVVLYSPDFSDEDITPKNFEGVVFRSALKRRIHEKGPRFCQKDKTAIKFAEDFEPDNSAGDIKITYYSTPATLRWDADNEVYKVTYIEWKEANESVMDAYKKDFIESAQQEIDSSLGEIDLERHNGFDKYPGLVKEFNKMREVHSIELASVFESKAKTLTGSSGDLEGEINAISMEMTVDLRLSLKEIRGNFKNEIDNKEGGVVQIPNKEYFRDRYINPLLTAGIPGAEYKQEVIKMHDEFFNTNDLEYSVLTGEKYFQNYYLVKHDTLKLFYSKTGLFAFEDSLSSHQRDYINDQVKGPMNTELQRCYVEGDWLQRHTAGLKVPGTDINLDTQMSRVGFPEIRWPDIPDYDGDTASVSPYSGAMPLAPSTGGGHVSSRPSEGIKSTHTGVVEVLPEYPLEGTEWFFDNPSDTWEAYVAHTNNAVIAQFDNLETQLGTMDFESAKAGRAGRFFESGKATQRSRELLKALVREKKREYTENDAVTAKVDSHHHEFLTLLTQKNTTPPPMVLSEEATAEYYNKDFEKLFRDISSNEFGSEMWILADVSEKFERENGELYEDQVLDLISNLSNFPNDIPRSIEKLETDADNAWNDIQSSAQTMANEGFLGQTSSTEFTDAQATYNKASADFDTYTKNPECPITQNLYKEYIQLKLDALIESSGSTDLGSFSSELHPYESPEWQDEYFDYYASDKKAAFEEKLDAKRKQFGMLSHVDDDYDTYVIQNTNERLDKIIKKVKSNPADHSLEYNIRVLDGYLEEELALLDVRNQFWAELNDKVALTGSRLKPKYADDIAAYENRFFNNLNAPGESNAFLPSHRKEIYEYVMTLYALQILTDPRNTDLEIDQDLVRKSIKEDKNWPQSLIDQIPVESLQLKKSKDDDDKKKKRK